LYRGGSTFIIVLTSCYIDRIITDESDIIEDSTIWATRLLGVNAIIADIVLTAILGVNEQLVITVGDSELGLGLVLVAGEAIRKNLQFLCTSSTEVFGCPVTDTSKFIKVKTLMTITEIGNTVHTLIVLFAVAGVFVFEATILAGALNAGWLGLLLYFPSGHETMKS